MLICAVGERLTVCEEERDKSCWKCAAFLDCLRAPVVAERLREGSGVTAAWTHGLSICHHSSFLPLLQLSTGPITHGEIVWEGFFLKGPKICPLVGKEMPYNQ